MSARSPDAPDPLAELAQLRRELALAQRRSAQAERVARTSETLSTQSKRAMLHVRGRLEATIEELTVAKARAEDASRAKDRFLATVSHEMRTPLNGILGSLELLLTGTLDDEQSELVTVMHRSVASLTRIINDVLDFSKIEADRIELEREPFDLLACAREVTELELGAAFNKGVALELETAADLPLCVLGDALRLRQVLLNLVDNAVKFTEQGAVTVRVRRGDRAGQIHFAVRDTGVGIPADVLPSVFDAFTQADSSTTRKFGGTGLGLAICKQLVALMGGELEVTSELGRGTTFCFTCDLPDAAAQVGGSGTTCAPEPTAAAVAATHPLRVLVVDDNDSNRFLASRMLGKLGCEIVTAVDGLEAVERASAGGFDVIFMDCAMPVMDGLEATRQIRASGIATPIVAMTANAMAGDRDTCLAAGMTDYLAKPIRLRDMQGALASIRRADH